MSTKNNADILYVNGCSFAYGMGVDLSEEISKQKRFSKLLSDKIGVPDVNLSIPGSCNNRIARRTLVDFVELRPKLAIVMWSDPARYEVYEDFVSHRKYEEDLVQVRPLSVESLHKNRRRAFYEYYESISTRQGDIINTMYHMVSVKNAAEALGIKCIQIPFKDVFHKELTKCMDSRNTSFRKTLHSYVELLSGDDLIFGVDKKISFDSIIGAPTRNMSTVRHQEGHPSDTGHAIIADWLHHFMKEHDLV